MTNKFSAKSQAKLSECDERLQRVMTKVLETYDCSILVGHRGEADQNKAYAEKLSRLKYPLSKHNSLPSKAVDAVPYPIDWNDTKRFYHFAGFVLGVAQSMGIKLRWGGDWDSDNDFKDNSFNDLVHFEVVG